MEYIRSTLSLTMPVFRPLLMNMDATKAFPVTLRRIRSRQRLINTILIAIIWRFAFHLACVHLLVARHHVRIPPRRRIELEHTR